MHLEYEVSYNEKKISELEEQVTEIDKDENTKSVIAELEKMQKSDVKNFDVDDIKKLDELEAQLSKEFDEDKRAELAVQMQQTILDDNAFVFCSFLKMSMISRSNVTGYESHACDYYQVTADLDIN